MMPVLFAAASTAAFAASVVNLAVPPQCDVGDVLAQTCARELKLKLPAPGVRGLNQLPRKSRAPVSACYARKRALLTDFDQAALSLRRRAQLGDCAKKLGVKLPARDSVPEGKGLKRKQWDRLHDCYRDKARAEPVAGQDTAFDVGTIACVPGMPERKSDCYTSKECDARVFAWPGGPRWALVARTHGYEIWRDDTTLLLWSDRLPEEHAWMTATDIGLKQGELPACEVAGAANARIPGFDLPTVEEFRAAEKNGIRKVLSLEGDDYLARSGDRPELFDGDTGAFKRTDRLTPHAVRCVKR